MSRGKQNTSKQGRDAARDIGESALSLQPWEETLTRDPQAGSSSSRPHPSRPSAQLSIWPSQSLFQVSSGDSTPSTSKKRKSPLSSAEGEASGSLSPPSTPSSWRISNPSHPPTSLPPVSYKALPRAPEYTKTHKVYHSGKMEPEDREKLIKRLDKIENAIEGYMRTRGEKAAERAKLPGSEAQSGDDNSSSSGPQNTNYRTRFFSNF